MKLFSLPLFSLSLLACGYNAPSATQTNSTLRYVALGDSYTICEGASANESWPVLLAGHLTKNKHKAQLIANPSRTGWTTQNLIDRELPVFDKSEADFVTLLIGVNDWVRGVSKETFKKNFCFILDHLQGKLKNKTNIVIITIPDFSVVPAAATFGNGKDISNGIAGFNEIIVAEAKKRQLPIVDIFPVSQKMEGDSALVAGDGLHPSAKEYEIWEQLILPVVEKMLGK